MTNNYSADVRIWLDCGLHGVIPLAQASSEFVIAAKPRNVPPCNATIILTIDGQRIERPVKLVSGMSTDRPEAVVSSISGNTRVPAT